MKELLFILEHEGDEFYIKGKYENDKIEYFKLDESGYTESIEDVTKDYFFIYQEEKTLCEILINKIKFDTVIDKVKRNQSLKLMFKYKIEEVF